jgi:hypothetical protein
MLLAACAKSSLCHSNACANLSKVKRPVWICFQEFLETRDDRMVATVTDWNFGSRARGKATDHDMNELFLQRLTYFLSLKHFGDITRKFSNCLVERPEF